jgi:hypothetical protein
MGNAATSLMYKKSAEAMMKILVISIISLVLTGCAERFYYKPGATTQSFYMDRAACEMGAAGLPQPPAQPSQPSSYTGITTCYGNSCTTTVTPGPDYSGTAYAGAALGHALSKQRYIHNCLIAKGYTESTVQEQQTPMTKQEFRIGDALCARKPEVCR